MIIKEDEIIIPVIPPNFNSKIISSNKKGILLKGKWEFIKSYARYILSPKYDLEQTLGYKKVLNSFEDNYIDYLGESVFLIALGLATNRDMEDKQLICYRDTFNYILSDYNNDTLITICFNNL
jgi:hypothetical protein